MIAILAGLLLAAAQDGPSVDLKHGDLKVSENKRYLAHADGTPFFWLGDTAWELFHRLTREEAERYLENRRAKRFTVIQAVALAELDGLNTPNAYGHRPLADNDPSKPVEEYWKHVDWIVKKAEEKGLYIGLLPTWGDKVTKMWGVGPEIFTVENAHAYGKWIAARYKDAPNIIWINGGDRPADKSVAIWRSLAGGLKEGDGGRHLITFHPPGGRTSSAWFHADDWLAMNMLQTGHSRNTDSAARIDADYRRDPAKPVLDGEPIYEDHPLSFNPKNGYATPVDVRNYLYWDLFAGACGHTYGCHNIWQMMAEGRKPISWAHASRSDSLDLPGAGQLRHARTLLESRPYLSRVPDQSLVLSGDRVRATRGDGYALIYVPFGKPVTISLGKISGDKVQAWWMDPREGTHLPIGEIPNTGTREFVPPSADADWVLVLDDASRKFAMLGAKGNLPPTVALQIPAGPLTAPASVTLTATAADADGRVAKIEYYVGTEKVGEGASATWKVEKPGYYALSARATDDRGATSTSAPLRVTVGPFDFVFHRAINLNGPALTIDGHAWEGKDAPDFGYTGSAFENQAVPLLPPTDPERATMIRSSIYHPKGSNVTVKGLPSGTYQLFLYIWEDNDPATFDVRVQGVLAEAGVVSGQAGEWKKLGPWIASVKDGTLNVTCSPGDANLSGLEIWRLEEK